MRSRRRLSFALLVVLVALPVLAAPASAVDPQRAEHERILRYWTPERMQSAKWRDIVYDQGRFTPVARPDGSKGKPGGGGGGDGSTSTVVTGAQWPDHKGTVYSAVGRVYFRLNSGNYICSGTVATDAQTDRSVVLTAAHCAYDGADGGFASNWVFIPEFDTNPTYTCANTRWGCWTARSLHVHQGFADEAGFTSAATRHDWAFAVVDGGGHSGAQLDATVGSFPIAFTDYALNTQTYAFGYPAGGKYKGNELIYCAGPLAFDSWNDNQTYRLQCNMTGGSSGGGWFVNFDAATGSTGTLSSVNSYRYSGGDSMYGPKFNSKTGATWNSATSGSMPGSNTIVTGP